MDSENRDNQINSGIPPMKMEIQEVTDVEGAFGGVTGTPQPVPS